MEEIDKMEELVSEIAFVGEKLKEISKWLVVIGAANWGLVGLFNFPDKTQKACPILSFSHVPPVTSYRPMATI